MRGALAAAAFLAAVSPLLSQTFETETLVVPADDGPIELTVEIADEPDERARGYMERVGIGDEEGMLFVYERDRPIAMWMQNTPTSLDMVFIEADGTIESIAPNAVPFSRAIVQSEGPVRYVLEVVAGSAERWGLEPGDRLTGDRFSR